MIIVDGRSLHDQLRQWIQQWTRPTSRAKPVLQHCTDVDSHVQPTPLICSQHELFPKALTL